jgi:hypothetical protein
VSRVSSFKPVLDQLTGLVDGDPQLVVSDPQFPVSADMVKDWIGIETTPPPAPDATIAKTRDDLTKDAVIYGPQQSELLIARTAHAAGLFGVEVPDNLVLHDRDGDDEVDGPRSHSPSMDWGGPDVRAAFGPWARAHPVDGATGSIDPTALYTRAREGSYSKTWDGPGAPATSDWRDDAKARELAHGPQQAAPAALPPEDVPTRFGLPPADPRRLDDPGYNRRTEGFRGP